MAPPLLLCIVGNRADALACSPVIEALQNAPFRLRVAAAGEEITELEQALHYLHIEPDVAHENKRPHLADANLDARLLMQMELILRHQAPAAILISGNSATAWAAAVAAYYKKIPVIQLNAGVFAVEARRPWPEWRHRAELARLVTLPLCGDEAGAQALEQQHGNPAALVTGYPADDLLPRALEALEDSDPTLAKMREGAEPALFFLRRREHHANALRPLCEAVNVLARRFEEVNFVAVHSLQAHICDALVALLERRENLRDVSPLPFGAFIRLLARCRVVTTDSFGVGREALLLNRPLVLVGENSETNMLRRLAEERRLAYRVAPMDQNALEATLADFLEDVTPCPAAAPDSSAGRRAAEAICQWMDAYFS